MNDEQRRAGPPPDASPTQPWQPPPPAGHPFGQVQAPPPPPRSGPPIGLAALAVLLVIGIALVAGYVFFLAGPGPTTSPTGTLVAASPSPTARTPSPAAATPTPASPTPTSPTESPDGSPAPSPSASPGGSPGESPAVGRTPPPDIRAAIEQVVSQMPAIRQLDPLREVEYVLLTREEATQELLAALEEELDEEELRTEERLLQRLGLLPDDSDLLELFSELYTGSVAAFYRPDTGAFYIIERDAPFGPADRMFVAHEYTHALQDQHYDLEGTRLTDNAEGDAQLAQLAAVEGDASLAMYIWAFSNLSPQEQLELFDDLTPTDPDLLERMPQILSRQLAFPYNEGFLFSSAVLEERGWEGINATLTDPPASTEQILHPDKYLAGEEPIDVEPSDWLDELGDGWEVAYEQTMGELNTQIWLADGEEPPPIPLPGQQEPWQEAAAGWGGDRLQMYEHPDGRWAITWEMEWDSEADEEEFVELAETLVDGLDHPGFVGDTRPGLTRSWVYLASDEQTLATFSDLDEL